MEISPLTLNALPQWADLLALAFHKPAAAMQQTLTWLHTGRSIVAWGAWEGETLAAQYACMMVNLDVPGHPAPLRAGMSMNMAVHPAYRGRGLIKQVSRPVYDSIRDCGGVAGVGFSNAEGVKVDKRSKGYGYQVVGRMQSVIAWLPNPRTAALMLTQQWQTPSQALFPLGDRIRFSLTPELLHHRYAHPQSPHAPYWFGMWQEGDALQGVVIFRYTRLRGVRGVSLYAAYSHDLPELLRRWSKAMHRQGISMAHLLTSPQSTLIQALKTTAVCIPTPLARSPYYLTAKPLCDDTPPRLFDFSAWDCVGGDVL